MEHYHKRSNIESAYFMTKGKFGDSVRSKSEAGRVNEVLCKVLCHNICVLIQAINELDIEPVFVQNRRLHKKFSPRGALRAKPADG